MSYRQRLKANNLARFNNYKELDALQHRVHRLNNDRRREIKSQQEVSRADEKDEKKKKEEKEKAKIDETAACGSNRVKGSTTRAQKARDEAQRSKWAEAKRRLR